MVTHPSNSHLFPSRGRSNSSPAARPSSLSRLLAQASPTAEVINDPMAEIPRSPTRSRSRSPKLIVTESPSSSPPQEPAQKILVEPIADVVGNGNMTVSGGSNTNLSTHTTSPARPGSRGSRLSTTSRFSVGRKPTLGIVSGALPKAAATTALSEQVLARSTSPSRDNPFRSPLTSSPDQSIVEAMLTAIDDTNVTAALADATSTTDTVGQRRRTTSSFHPPRVASTSSQATIVARPSSAASTTLANLASSWGVAFGRKRNADMGAILTPPVESPLDGSGTSGNVEDDGVRSGKSARELLKRF